MAERHLLVVLHDVAPPTWPHYQPFVQALDRLGPVPLGLVVGPGFHRRLPVGASPLRAVLGRRLVRGDALLLPGYCPFDDQPAPRDRREWFMRRVYTREGEFLRL